MIGYFAVTGPIFQWFDGGNNKQGSQTASLSGIDQIHVKTTSGQIQIVTDARDELRAELNGSNTKHLSLIVDRKGSTLLVELKRKRSSWRLFSFWPFNESKLEVAIPQNYAHLLQVEATSGNITIAGTQQQPLVLNDLELRIKSGNVSLKHLQAESLNFKGTSGNVKADHVITGESEWKLSSGNMKLNEFQGPIAAQLTSGNMEMNLSKLTGPIESSITSGRAVIDLPDDANFTLDAKVTSGKIRNEFPLQDAVFDNRNWQGKYGNGEHLIKLNSTSGNITIK